MEQIDLQIDAMVKMLGTSVRCNSLYERLSESQSASDRMDAYMDFLSRVGRSVFRWYDGNIVVGGQKGQEMLDGLLYHDGEVWCPVDRVVFMTALKRFCRERLKMHAQEWFRGEKWYVRAVSDGAKLSKLFEDGSGVIPGRSVVGFKNGVYDFTDLDNIVYHPFSDKLPVMSLLDYEYRKNDDCPLWRAFLDSVLSKSQQLLLQKYFGLGMCDRRLLGRKIEQSLWLVGPGGAGKSTIMNVVSYVYGQENISGTSLGSLISGSSESRARFVLLTAGKIFNYCGEVQMDDMTRYADAFKSLCSGEPQPVRRLGYNVEMRNDIPYLIFNMNRKPRSRNIDGALMRRLLFVTFRSAIREEDRDPMLEEKLKAEASGIRNWMIQGFKMLRDDGFKLEQTDIGKYETESWLIENGQTVGLFMRKCGCRECSQTGVGDKPELIPVVNIFDCYSAWCTKWGYEPECGDVSGMGRVLRSLGYQSHRLAAGMAYKIYGNYDKLISANNFR